MAIHTGYLVGSADPKANVRHFASILAAYPEARFDLYHLNYPWFEDMVAILKRFPNTWANCCWTHVIDPCGTTRFLQSALGAIPANRIFGFGGDFAGLPEATIAHLAIARENITVALETAVGRHWCSRAAALDVARLWLYENPKTFYSIGSATESTITG
jgi:predicted TIM-barrel fold metal-dependent hydrolase